MVRCYCNYLFFRSAETAIISYFQENRDAASNTGGIPAFVELVLFFILHPHAKFKAIGSVAAVMLYFLLLPGIWGINLLKETILLQKHQVFLEQVTEDILEEKIDIPEANNLLQKQGVTIYVKCIPNEKEHVLFRFGGMIDNCYGIAWSETGKQPSENFCGEFTSWKKKKRNWYTWTTT